MGGGAMQQKLSDQRTDFLPETQGWSPRGVSAMLSGDLRRLEPRGSNAA